MSTATLPAPSLRTAIVADITRSVQTFFSFKTTKEVKVQTQAQKNARKALAFANQLVRQETDGVLTRKELFEYAWDEIHNFGDDYRYVKFEKVNGEVATRLVYAGHWSEHYTPKGTGRPMKPGQVGLIDAAKKHTGKRSFISTYLSRIVEIF